MEKIPGQLRSSGNAVCLCIKLLSLQLAHCSLRNCIIYHNSSFLSTLISSTSNTRVAPPTAKQSPQANLHLHAISTAVTDFIANFTQTSNYQQIISIPLILWNSLETDVVDLKHCHNVQNGLNLWSIFQQSDLRSKLTAVCGVSAIDLKKRLHCWFGIMSKLSFKIIGH